MEFDDNDVVVIVLDRGDFEHKDRLNAMIEMMETLAAEGGEPRNNFTFHGYEADKREVWQIPECVAFCKRIMMEVPHFIKVVDEKTFAVLLFCTALKVDGRWSVNPAWQSVLPDWRGYSLGRKD